MPEGAKVMINHIDIRVTGRVQGVYFRASARDIAVSMGIKGFVKNEADGSVYLEAEGNPEQLDRFLRWCKEGPSLALVKDVKVSTSPIQHFKDFVIR